MSILIKNMKMPINCIYEENGKTKFCFFCNHDDTPFCAYRGAGLGLDDERPDWCPLVEVPTPHGDLIDRDALEKAGRYEVYIAKGVTRACFIFDGQLYELPTIIEREADE